MLPLLIRIQHAETGVVKEAGFRRSPVRIGRNPLNDLPLAEGFVSQWHAVVRLEGDATRYIDLGSTNGTKRGGSRLEKNVEVDLDPDTPLVIGPLTLTFLRMPLDEGKFLPRRASAFRLGADAEVKTEASTVVLEEGAAGKRASRPSGASPAPIDPDGLAERAKRTTALVAALRAAYERYEEALVELETKASVELESAKSDADRAALQGALRTSFPKALEHASFRKLTNAPPPPGSFDGTSWLARLLHPLPTHALGDASLAMERAGALLETFAQAFVDLRDGQQQERAQLSVEVGGDASPLPTTTNPRVLLAHLLDPVDPNGRLEDLSRAFADLALHQLGTVSGAVDGARDLLARLSPHAIGAARVGEIARSSPSFGDYLWPFRAAGAYYRFAARHVELSAESSFTKVLFGQAFARAYYRLTGSRSGALAKSAR